MITMMTAKNPSFWSHLERLGKTQAVILNNFILIFFSFAIKYLWEMTAEIICYKATFHAIAQKFELMHTGWILIFKISFSNHSILLPFKRYNCKY